MTRSDLMPNSRPVTGLPPTMKIRRPKAERCSTMASSDRQHQQHQRIVGNAVELPGPEHAEQRRHVAGRRALRIGEPEALQQDHRRERGEKRRHLPLRDQKAVEQADCNRDQQSHGERWPPRRGRRRKSRSRSRRRSPSSRPTDRSSPRTIMTKAWPIATIASGANCSSRLERLPALTKAGEITPPEPSRIGRIEEHAEAVEQGAH